MKDSTILVVNVITRQFKRTILKNTKIQFIKAYKVILVINAIIRKLKMVVLKYI